MAHWLKNRLKTYQIIIFENANFKCEISYWIYILYIKKCNINEENEFSSLMILFTFIIRLSIKMNKKNAKA